MLSITDLKKDTLIQLEGQPYRVVEYGQKQMGRGGSIVNTKLKNLIDGSVLQKTFKGNDKIEEAEVSNQKAQFLYADDSQLHLMNETTYEQIAVSRDLLGRQADLLKEGESVTVQSFNERFINVDLPLKMTLKVIDAPEVTKGDTQSTVMKTVKLETGAEIQAPIFIKTNDNVVVDSRDFSYVERAKE